MHYHHKFAVIGFIISLGAIILGTIGLTTSNWISINEDQSYDLFRHHKTSESDYVDSFRTSQYVEITGYIVLVIGLFIGVLGTAMIDKRSIHCISPIIIIIGTGTMMIGFIIYIKNLIEHHDNSSKITKFNLGYSMILMVTASLMGCVSTAYFSFTAGYIHRHILSTSRIH